MTRVAQHRLPPAALPPATPDRDTPSGRALSIGTRLGRYELVHPIAAGGMAEVWVAEQIGDLGFTKTVALKMIRPDLAFDALFRSMFLDEARLASRIHHANVVDVLDLGVDKNVVFQAMPFVEGAALSVWTAQAGRRPLGVALRIVIDILRGLHAAHELCDDDGFNLGLVHRDVSPQNILVGIDGTAKLADFGIAKAFGRITDETCSGDVKGKLGYLAPEVLQGRAATRSSDLFSVGVVLWELLAGTRLFDVGEHDTKSVRATMKIVDPRRLASDVPGPVASIAMRALEPDPRRRFRTASEMAEALEVVVEELGLDASTPRVATCLARDLGPMLEEKREAIRAARRGRGRIPVRAAPPSEPGRAPETAFAIPAASSGDLPSPPKTSPSWWIHAMVGAAILFGVAGTAVRSRFTGPRPPTAPVGAASPALPSAAAPAASEALAMPPAPPSLGPSASSHAPAPSSRSAGSAVTTNVRHVPSRAKSSSPSTSSSKR